MRTEPHNAVCEACGTLVIDAILGGSPIRLDATPTAHGPYRAWLNGAEWRVITDNGMAEFHGMRRRIHVCPDYQLELSTEAAPEAADPVPEKENNACRYPSSRPSTAEPSTPSP